MNVKVVIAAGGDAIVRETRGGYCPTFWFDFCEDWTNCMLASALALGELASLPAQDVAWPPVEARSLADSLGVPLVVLLHSAGCVAQETRARE